MARRYSGLLPVHNLTTEDPAMIPGLNSTLQLRYIWTPSLSRLLSCNALFSVRIPQVQDSSMVMYTPYQDTTLLGAVTAQQTRNQIPATLPAWPRVMPLGTRAHHADWNPWRGAERHVPGSIDTGEHWCSRYGMLVWVEMMIPRDVFWITALASEIGEFFASRYSYKITMAIPGPGSIVGG
ncbi:hypothetical protein BD779DRAFT_1473948 [Infundibulicybe gibba]|nr:hypothetical protein BD779DRAFT_1473948 [Infundibulicybe gibba]